MTSAKKRTALVTGANRGIGLSIARQLAQRGIKVLIGARDQDKGIAACKQLQSEGLEAYFILLDVTRAISIEAAIGKIKDDFRGLDILVNNAGIMIDTQSGILELDPAGVKGVRSLDLTICRFALGFDEIGFSIYDLTLILHDHCDD